MVGVGRWLLAVVIALAAAPAHAVTYNAFRLDDGTGVVVVTGEFLSTDRVTNFLAAIRSVDAVIVGFDSPGGSPYSAMEHGRMIRQLGLRTLQSRELECASACAFAFVGGAIRFAQPGSIGVHRSSLRQGGRYDPHIAVDVTQELTGQLLAYLREMDIDPELLQISLEYGADDMRYLSGSEMARMRVTNTTEYSMPPMTQRAPAPQAPRSYTPPPPQQITRPEPRDMRPVAQDFVTGVIAAHTQSNDAAIAMVRRTYGGTVHYFGETRTLDDILTDKHAYFIRWPERSYQIRPGTLWTTCGPSTCEVRGLYDWSVRSLPRQRQAAGAASFEFAVDLSGPDMRIVRENSTVIDRR